MKANEFQCAMCGNIYEKGISDEEAHKELEDIFGKEMATHDNTVYFCDDCFNLINPENHPDKVESAKKEFYSKRN